MMLSRALAELQSRRRAMQELPEHVVLGDGEQPVFREECSFVRLNVKLPGNKIRLPGDFLRRIIQRSPRTLDLLTFHILSLDNGKVTHATAMDFVLQSCEPIELSETVTASLGCYGDQSSGVILTLVDLPYAEQVQFEALSEELRYIPDLRAFLEQGLRSYSVLTQGDVLSITSSKPDLRVSKLLPGPACSLVDVEVESDITFPALVQEKLLIPLGEPVKGSVSSSWEGVFIIKSKLVSGKTFLISLEGEDDLDLFASYSPPLPCARSSCHSAANYEAGSKKELKLACPPNAVNDWNVRLIIGVEVPHSGEADQSNETGPSGEVDELNNDFKSTKNFTIKVNITECITEEPRSEPTTVEAPDLTFVCETCKRNIPLSAKLLHEAHCHRFFVRCATCGLTIRKSQLETHVHCAICSEPMDRNLLEAHNHSLHRLVDCSCGSQVMISELAEHRNGDCPNKFEFCPYCKLLVKAKDSDGINHQARCGSRTTVCPYCNETILVRCEAVHTVMLHELPPADISTAVCPDCKETAFLTEDQWFIHLSEHLAGAETNSPCSNMCCENYDIGVTGSLCERCRRHFSSDIKSTTTLLKRYVEQLQTPCNLPGCSGCSLNERSPTIIANSALQWASKSKREQIYRFCTSSFVRR